MLSTVPLLLLILCADTSRANAHSKLRIKNVVDHPDRIKVGRELKSEVRHWSLENYYHLLSVVAKLLHSMFILNFLPGTV